MPRGIYVRTLAWKQKQSEDKKGKLRPHKDGCKCYYCKVKRGERSGKNHPMYGKHFSKYTCEKRRQLRKEHPHKLNCSCGVCKAKRGECKGKSNPRYGNLSIWWRGNKVGMNGVHSWLVREYGKAKYCENSNCNGKCKWYEWSSRTHVYKRNRNDFQQLCRSCHKLFDNGKLVLG